MSEKKRDRAITIIAVAILAIVLVGEVVVYTSDYTDYSADASLRGDGKADYSVTASGSKNYTAISVDNGGHDVVEKVYVYYDESYKSCYEDVNVSIGARELDQEYYVEQLAPTLRYRNINDVAILNATELREQLEKDVSSENIRSGLICLSGAFPDTIYNGNQDDLIFEWISKGGSLYWAGNMIGKYSASQTALKEIPNYQEVVFGSECLYTGENPVAYDEVGENRFTGSLSLVSNNVKYGINGSLLPTGTEYLGIGFESDGWTSITMVSHGTGMICVIGGDYSNNQRNDLAQVICSGIGPNSTIIDIYMGKVTRGTVNGTLDVSGNAYVFVYLGGYYPVYCKAIRL